MGVIDCSRSQWVKARGKYGLADVNPSKYVADMQTLRQYVFGEGDYLVVLAEDAGVPKPRKSYFNGAVSCYNVKNYPVN